ncbi:cystathionine gamma-synthase [Staphylococcus gallinarum]|uniref:Cystathionine gamma-synthase n=1 Tax=Staphylococcus gallinarum TaxID=1293 RepID=A0A380FP64_STAGA|nr:cystathionine gamma-synthase [Staphylococcus gallinarum]
MNKKTRLIHGGLTTDPYTGAVTTPNLSNKYVYAKMKLEI